MALICFSFFFQKQTKKCKGVSPLETNQATCLQLARDAKSYDRPASAAIVYDELFRKRLADRCQKNAPGYDPNTGTHVVDEPLLRQAVKVYYERNEHFKGGKGKGGKGESKGSKGAPKGGGSWSQGWGNKNESWGKYDAGKGEKRTYPWEADHYAKRQKGGSKGGHHLNCFYIFSLSHKKNEKKRKYNIPQSLFGSSTKGQRLRACWQCHGLSADKLGLSTLMSQSLRAS
jgi:hypothetical protein